MEAVNNLLQRKFATDTGQLEALGTALAHCDVALSADQLDILLDGLRAALRSANAHVCSAALSCCTSLFPLLEVTPQKDTPSQLKIALIALTAQGGLFDRLGDKDRIRESAGRALLAVGRACVAAAAAAATSQDAEPPLSLLDRLVKEHGLGSKAPRVREMTLHFIAQIRSDHPKLPLRPYIVPLVTALEDQDQQVRHAAKEAIVSIFSNAAIGSAARADLKTQLVKHQVRKTTADAILSRVLGRNEVLSDGSSPRSRTPEIVGGGRMSPDGAARKSGTNGVSQANGNLQPIYAASAKDVESIFTGMQPALAGVETEHNWKLREKHVATVRGMLQSGLHIQYLEGFLNGLRTVMDGLLRTVVSLRTTLMVNTCHLFAELASNMEASFDALVDSVLPHLLKMTAQTKKLAVTSSQQAIESIITHCSYRDKMLSTLQSGMAEKVATARQASISLIKLLIEVHGTRSRATIELGVGLDLLQQAIRIALTDANPSVREVARPTFWLAYNIWPQQFDRLKEGVDPTTRLQLEKAGGNRSAVSGAGRPRPSVRQMISARKSESVLGTAPPGGDANIPPVPRPRTVSASTASSLSAKPRSPTRLPVAVVPPSPTRLPAHLEQAARSAVQIAASVPLPVQEDDLISNELPPFTPGRKSAANGSIGSPASSRRRSYDARQNLGNGIDAPTLYRPSDEMVEDAMRLQAEQAEQAAAQLLQLTEEEAETTPVKPARALPAGAAQLAATSVYVDSPAPTPGVASQLRRHLLKPGDCWWLKVRRELPLFAAKPASMADVDEGITAMQTKSATHQDLLHLTAAVRSLQSVGEDSFRADRLLRSLGIFLRQVLKDETLCDDALYIWQCLIQSQRDLLVGREMEAFELLFDLQKNAPFQTLIKLDAIAGLLGEQVEPLYAIRCLRTALEPLFSTTGWESRQENAVLMLAMRILGLLFRRLPAEVLEEEIPLTGQLLTRALTCVDSLPREAAVFTLTVAALILGDVENLFDLLDVAEGQKGLLTYFYAQAKESHIDISLQ